MEPSNSPRRSLNWIDFYKSARGALVVFVGAFSAEFITQIQHVFSAGAFPTTLEAAIVGFKFAVAATVVELGRRYLTNQAK